MLSSLWLNFLISIRAICSNSETHSPGDSQFSRIIRYEDAFLVIHSGL